MYVRFLISYRLDGVVHICCDVRLKLLLLLLRSFGGRGIIDMKERLMPP